MRSTLLKVFQVAPAAFGAVVAFGGVASAQAVPTADPVNPTLQRSEQYYVGPSMINQAQVTSVSEFVDVKPTDWAFLALQSLVERYGCIVGLPTNPPTYQGRRATTRFEFAAGLNACLDRINELIAAAVEPLATKEDLLVLQKLQEEFAAELSIIRGRVDALEARTALLEQQQFSTVTKLRSEIIFAPYGVADTGVAYNRIENAQLSGNRAFTGALTAGAGRGAVVASGANPRGLKASTADKLAFSYRARLNFDTSFTGNDFLRVRLQAADIANLAAATGANEARLSFDTATGGNVTLDELFYRFSFDKGRGTIQVSPASPGIDALFFSYAPLASDGTAAISRFGRFNPLFYRPGNPGGSSFYVNYQFNPIFAVGASYQATNPNSVAVAGAKSSAWNPDLGLFGSNYTANFLLDVQPRRDFRFGVGFAQVYNEDVNRVGGTAASGINLTSGTGTDFAVNPFSPAGTPGLAPITRTAVNMQTVNLMFQWRALPIFTLAGWFGYGWVRGESDTPALPAQGTRRANLLTAALQFAFPDVFGRRGDLGGVIVGIPPYVTASEWNGGTLASGNNIPAGVAGPNQQGPRKLNLRDTSVPVHLEAFYRFQVNKFLSVTPGAFVVFNPNGQDTNDPIIVYTIRTTFAF
ncbi:iron uptake porin [Gloeomargaritales cyanobacterium VI4D9]|nr:iron uptake porin [Gloeomargaritales cyanobacterium VI4D9]